MTRIITNFDIFLNEKYVFEQSSSSIMIPTEKTLIEILERQKKYNSGKESKESSNSHKLWKQRQDSLDIYNKMPQEEKDKVLSSLKKEFERLKIKEDQYRKVMDQSSDKASKNGMYQKPYVIITKETIVNETKPTIEPGVIKETPADIRLIPDSFRNNLFKDNRWENKPDAYTSTEGLEEVKKNLDLIKDIVKTDLNLGGGYIKDIQIVSSCSRLRNTGDNPTSWYELSKKRSETFTEILLDRLKEMNLPEDYKNKLRDKITISFTGFNGDGTSGPDPLPNYQRGYYLKNNKFKNEVDGLLKNKNTLDILVCEPGKKPELTKAIDLDGNPVVAELKDNKIDYKKYQYNDIVISFNPKVPLPSNVETEPSKKEPEIIKTDNYSYKIALTKYEWSKSKTRPDFSFNPSKFIYKLKKMMPKGKSPDWSKCLKSRCPLF